MHIHILGICGTFMGGIAQIARRLGHQVTGSDQNVYPPMSDQLEQAGIALMQGYEEGHLDPLPDLVVVGNTISRGNPALEHVLNQQIPYISGPEWLYQGVLKDKHVLGVSGTHGKTTTTTILSWILEYAGLNPGFLIGGVAENFGISARYTDSDYFVIEADEYDTAFSDKRSKFVHYHPKTLIINNIEFDHADIFQDIAAIRREFHHLLRIMPQQARIIYPENDEQVKNVLDMGCWSEIECFGEVSANWTITARNNDFSHFKVSQKGKEMGEVNWLLIGEHNANNALAAIIAAEHVGVPVDKACAALSEFKSVKRRLECIFESGDTRIYDDFAHHPTAISRTLEALRQHAGNARLIAIMEPRSNTMRMGVHANTLAASFQKADQILLFQAYNVGWDIAEHMVELGERCRVFKDIDDIVSLITKQHQAGDQIVIMSNGGFGSIHKKLIEALS
ncbi:MAG: UDP-N-acetylmuramate:L-alanyl-gamma-D-glutamyl-meso-diaminopimelate ligase [Proteobacteria bacterium]|nr:UDP-N-acetylmuramate:L-alanyl-gamma-D-glutamyl-meso-diaminopimelate ligase [Pseudomonadota bacterium]NOG59764.1 UDP-N-acetylmuramate:L-alanyl-gamma-D-glutamyl-meso-diaminopimelate ligase [Pseudomonadota bacterium]